MRPEELNQILQKEVIVKMSEDLIDRLFKIDEKLKVLKVGEVLDVSNLKEEEVKTMVQLYSKQYFLRGPVEDNEHARRYVLAFMSNSRGNENA